MTQFVYVFDKFGDVVEKIPINSNLDTWDGTTWNRGIQGQHLGIAKMKTTGQYVLIYTYEKPDGAIAEVVSDKEAYDMIISTGNIELLEKEPFKGLKRFEE